MVFNDRHLVVHLTGIQPTSCSHPRMGSVNRVPMVKIDCYRVGLPPPSTAIQRKKYLALTNITMLKLSSGQVAITYISSPIQYQDLAQLEFIAHYPLMLRAPEAALDPKRCDPPD